MRVCFSSESSSGFGLGRIFLMLVRFGADPAVRLAYEKVLRMAL